MRLTITPRLLTLAAATLLALPAALAQNAVGGQGDQFKDTNVPILKLQPGQRVAVVEFEDLECPACAHAAPIVHKAIERYKIPFIRRDFPLSQHIWSRDAAIIARYLEDKVSPELAEQYRLDVFAAQSSINSKDDMQAFSRSWFQRHGKVMPFALGPDSLFAAEVQADLRLGERIGLQHTPTIFVLSVKGWTQVVDVQYLYTTIDQALAMAPAPAAKPALKKPASTTVQR